jgi:uncharacterized membrane protein
MLQAAGDASAGPHTLKVLAVGSIRGATVTRTAEPLSGERQAMEAVLTVLASPPPFTVDLTTLGVQVEEDQSATVNVVVRRHDGFDGEIKLSASGYSARREPITNNIEVQPITLKAGETRAALNLKARLDAETGTRPIYVRGESKVDGETNTQFSQAIPLTIKAIPFTVKNTMKRLSVAVLPAGAKSAASEAEFAVRASRRGWFTDQINLSLEGLPEGVIATSTNLPSQVNEVTFKLATTDKAPTAKDFQITVVGSANAGGRAYQQRTDPMTLSITAPQNVADTK